MNIFAAEDYVVACNTGWLYRDGDMALRMDVVSCIRINEVFLQFN